MRLPQILLTVVYFWAPASFAVEHVNVGSSLDLKLPKAVALEDYDKYDCANSKGENCTIVIHNNGKKPKDFVLQSYVEFVENKITRLLNGIHTWGTDSRGWDAVVELTIFHTGELRGISIRKSSGSKIIDNKIEDSIKKISPFPAFPEQITEKAGCIKLIRTFKVEAAISAK